MNTEEATLLAEAIRDVRPGGEGVVLVPCWHEGCSFVLFGSASEVEKMKGWRVQHEREEHLS